MKIQRTFIIESVALGCQQSTAAHSTAVQSTPITEKRSKSDLSVSLKSSRIYPNGNTESSSTMLQPPKTSDGNQLGIPPANQALVSGSLQPLGSGSATGNPRNKVALAPGHSLIDWVRLGKAKGDMSGMGGKKIDVTEEMLAQHCTRDDAWTAIRGVVVNITLYMDFHPGGVDELMRAAGRDGTSLFDEVHQWVNFDSLMSKCVIGRYLKPVNTANNNSSKAPLIKPLPPRFSTLGDSNQLFVDVPDFYNTGSDGSISQAQLPHYDWSQTDTSVALFVYTRCENTLRDGLTVRLLKQRNLHVTVGIAPTLHFHIDLELEKAVEVDFTVDHNASLSRIDISFEKVERGVSWSSIGEPGPRNKHIIAITEEPTEYQNCTLVAIEPVSWDTHFYTLQLPPGSRMWVPAKRHVLISALVEADLEVSHPYTVIPKELYTEPPPPPTPPPNPTPPPPENTITTTAIINTVSNTEPDNVNTETNATSDSNNAIASTENNTDLANANATMSATTATAEPDATNSSSPPALVSSDTNTQVSPDPITNTTDIVAMETNDAINISETGDNVNKDLNEDTINSSTVVNTKDGAPLITVEGAPLPTQTDAIIVTPSSENHLGSRPDLKRWDSGIEKEESSTGGGVVGVVEGDGSTIYLMIKLYPRGLLTPKLAASSIGSTWKMSTMYVGDFDNRRVDEADDIILFAAGTGFTPMTSIIRYCVVNQKPGRCVSLIFFNRGERDILWREQLNLLAKQYDWFSVRFILSAPEFLTSWKGPTGRIVRAHVNRFHECKPKPNRRSLVCACGPNTFTSEACRLSKEVGHPEECIYPFS